MRINPIGVNYYQQKLSINTKNATNYVSQPNFCGKHSSAKFFGSLFGTLATAGAIGGSLIMSGGLSLPFILGYGALGAAGGAVIGHTIDKGASEDKNIDKNA